MFQFSSTAVAFPTTTSSPFFSSPSSSSSFLSYKELDPIAFIATSFTMPQSPWLNQWIIPGESHPFFFDLKGEEETIEGCQQGETCMEIEEVEQQEEDSEGESEGEEPERIVELAIESIEYFSPLGLPSSSQSFASVSPSALQRNTSTISTSELASSVSSYSSSSSSSFLPTSATRPPSEVMEATRRTSELQQKLNGNSYFLYCRHCAEEYGWTDFTQLPEDDKTVLDLVQLASFPNGAKFRNSSRFCYNCLSKKTSLKKGEKNLYTWCLHCSKSFSYTNFWKKDVKEHHSRGHCRETCFDHQHLQH